MKSAPRAKEAAVPKTDALDELRCRNAELEEAVAARDAFLSFAIHELRNPMTPIIGQVDMLLQSARSAKGITSEQLTQRLAKLETAIKHFQTRAAMLLDVSRFNAGAYRLDLETVSLSDVVRETAESYTAAAEKAKSSLIVSIADNINGLFDPLAIRQIVDNLLANAIRYSYRKPIEVTLTSLGDAMVLFSVRDYGPGISEEDQARIFQRFERVVGASTGGFGVGLWVTRQLVQAMAGAIDVSSSLGKGAIFTIKLPLHTKQDHR